MPKIEYFMNSYGELPRQEAAAVILEILSKFPVLLQTYPNKIIQMTDYIASHPCVGLTVIYANISGKPTMKVVVCHNPFNQMTVEMPIPSE